MKRIRDIVALTCLCMAMALLPGVALATTATSVIVGGVTLNGTTDIYATTDSSGKVTPGGNESGYNVKFQNGMLTLNGATVAGVVRQYSGSGADSNCAIYAAGELKLALIGANTVYSTGGADSRRGIFVYYLGAANDASLTIEGSGSLDVYAAAGGDHVHDGILVFGSLTINSGTITAEGRGTDGNSYGVRAVTDFLMTGGSLTATGGDVTGEHHMSCGVVASGTVTLSGGTLNAIGGAGTSSSYGMSSGVRNSIIINASANEQVKVTAKTTDMTDDGYRRAFNSAPVISDGATYTWSLTENNPNPTPSTTTPYAWESSQTFTELTLGQIVATPVARPAAGAYDTVQRVELSCTTAGATIRYTTDGSEPTASNTEYSASTPIVVASDTTIKAKAFKDGDTPSETLTAAYTIIPPSLTVSPSASFTQGAAPRNLMLNVGNEGSEPNNATHFGSLEISSDGVDFTDVSAEKYDLTYGSIHIALHQDYLNTLTPGAYRLRVNLAGRFAGLAPTTTLTVTDAVIPPKTGDSATPLLWLCLCLSSGAGLAVHLVMRRKQRNG